MENQKGRVNKEGKFTTAPEEDVIQQTIQGEAETFRGLIKEVPTSTAKILLGLFLGAMGCTSGFAGILILIPLVHDIFLGGEDIGLLILGAPILLLFTGISLILGLKVSRRVIQGIICLQGGKRVGIVIISIIMLLPFIFLCIGVARMIIYADNWNS